jgi:hypothetical protein
MPPFGHPTTCRSRDPSAPAYMSYWGQCCIVVKRWRPRHCAPEMQRIVVLAVVGDVLRPRGVGDCNTVPLPCSECVSNLDWSLISVLAWRRKKCLHSVIFRTLAATKRTLFGAATLSNSFGMTSVLIVGVRSSTIEFGSPAEKMMFPLGANKSVVWSCV